MITRKLKEEEIGIALKLCWDVFSQTIAPGYSPEAVAEFGRTVDYNNFWPKWKNEEVYMCGTFIDERLVGACAMSRMGHIQLFFVLPVFQGQGVGKELLSNICQYARVRGGTGNLTINAVPGSVDSFSQMGFVPMAHEQIVNGIRFVPMTYDISALPESEHRAKAKKTMTTMIIITAAAMAFFYIMYGVLFSKIYRSMMYEYENDYGTEYYDDELEDSDDEWL